MEETRIPAKQESIYKENSIAELPVVRVSGFGAFLDGGTGNSKDDILLHSAIQDGILDIHVLIHIAIADCIIPHTA